RTVDGAQARYLERVEPGLLLDQAISITNSPASRSVTGLSALEGATVWAIADGDVLGPFTVSDGEIADIGQVATNVTVGRWTPPYVETLPLPNTIAPQT